MEETFEQSMSRCLFETELIELKNMYVEDIKSGKLNPIQEGIFYYPNKKFKKIEKIGAKNLTRGKIRKLIDKSLKISDVAKHYGYKVKANKMICPFHNDSEPSLNLSDKRNCFYCFGCNTKGDIVEFIRRLECQKK